MPEMTELSLATAITAYIDAGKAYDSTYTASAETITGLLNKFIPEQYEVVSTFTDPLEVFDMSLQDSGADLEGFFKPLSLPADYTPAGGVAITAVSPNMKKWYSYPQGEKTFTETVNDTRIRRACKNSADLGKITASIMRSLSDGVKVWKYDAKKMTLVKWRSAVADKPRATQIVNSVKPTDTATGEAFLKLVRGYVSKACLKGSTLNQAGVLTQTRKEDLYLIILASIVDDITVDVLASAFAPDNANFNVHVIPVENFAYESTGAIVDSDINAILLDRQAFANFPIVDQADHDHNGKDHFDNYYRHYDANIMISSCANLVYFVEQGD